MIDDRTTATRTDHSSGSAAARTRVAVVIPALNEEQSLPLVLAALPPVDEVVVVDNGSTDRTIDVALEAGATVRFQPRRGYGSAVSAGLEHLQRNPPDIVVILDADFSDDPRELPALLEPILRDEADLVIGSRTLGHSESGALLPQQRFGNWLATRLIARRYGHHFTDLGPFRAVRWSALMTLGMVDADFGWNVEMQVKALRSGFRTVEVPVSYRRRIGVSKISGTLSGSIRAGTKIITSIVRYG